MPFCLKPLMLPVRLCLLAVAALAGCHRQQASGTDVSIRTTLVATPAALPLDGVSTSQLVAQVTTASGKPRVGFSLDLAPQDGGLLVVSDMTPTNEAGQSFGVVRCLTAGTHDIGLTTQYNDMSVALTDYTPITCAQIFSVGPPSAVTSTLTANPNVAAVDDPNGIWVTLTVQDANGYSVGPGIAVTLSADGNTTSINPNAVLTDNFGMAHAHVSSPVVQTEHVTAHIAASGAPVVLSTGVSFVAGAASAHASVWTTNPNVLFVAANGLLSCAQLSLRDCYANPVINAQVRVQASGSANVFTEQSGVTDALGHWSTQWSSTAAQSKSLVLQAENTALYTGATVVGGSPNALICTGLNSAAYVNVPQSLTIAAVDVFGNWAPGYTGQVVLSASSASATVPASYTFGANDGGGHTFAGGIVFGQAGNQTLTIVDNVNVELQCHWPVETVFDVPVVVPLYANAAAWTRWVRNDGPAYHATGALCDGSEVGDAYTACVHGGSMRAVDVPSAQDCNGLSATDNLGAFRWICDAAGTQVRMISASLHSGSGLSTLLDASASSLTAMSVTVSHGNVALFTTAPAVWWPDSITQATGGGALMGNTINVIDPNTAANYSVNSANTALLVPAGRTLNAASASGAHLSIAHTQFVWVEGALASAGAPQSILVTDSNHVVVRNATLAGASSQGLLGSGMRQSVVDGVLVNYLTGTGVGLSQQSSGNFVQHLRLNAPGAQGVQISGQSTGNMFVDLVIAASGAQGLDVTAQSNANRFDGLRISDAATGIAMDHIQGGVLHDVLVVNSQHAGVQLSQTSDIVWAAATFAANGDTAGWQGQALSHSVVSGAVFIDNAADGLQLAASANNTFVNISAANNASSGVSMSDDASFNNRFWAAVYVGDNLGGDCNTRPGLGHNGVYTAVAPGACTADPTVSNAHVTANQNCAASFVGPISTSDAANFTNSQGVSAFSGIVDWTDFANPYRAWGIASGPTLDANGRGACSAAHASCQIYDWRLAPDDSVLRGSVPTPDVHAQTVQHTWSDASVTTFYTGASERLGDGIGNDNGLCESGEACIAEPHMGAYQGADGFAAPLDVQGLQLYLWQAP